MFHTISLLLRQCQRSKTQQEADRNSMFHAFSCHPLLPLNLLGYLYITLNNWLVCSTVSVKSAASSMYHLFLLLKIVSWCRLAGQNHHLSSWVEWWLWASIMNESEDRWSSIIHENEEHWFQFLMDLSVLSCRKASVTKAVKLMKLHAVVAVALGIMFWAKYSCQVICLNLCKIYCIQFIKKPSFTDKYC